MQFIGSDGMVKNECIGNKKHFTTHCFIQLSTCASWNTLAFYAGHNWLSNTIGSDSLEKLFCGLQGTVNNRGKKRWLPPCTRHSFSCANNYFDPNRYCSYCYGNSTTAVNANSSLGLLEMNQRTCFKIHQWISITHVSLLFNSENRLSNVCSWHSVQP